MLIESHLILSKCLALNTTVKRQLFKNFFQGWKHILKQTFGA